MVIGSDISDEAILMLPISIPSEDINAQVLQCWFSLIRQNEQAWKL